MRPNRYADQRALRARLGTATLPPLRPRVEIAVRAPGPDAAQRADHIARGRHLARQEVWDELAELIAAADRGGQLTDGLFPVALLLAQGARSDVVQAARELVRRGEPKTALAILAAFRATLEDENAGPPLDGLAALAHVDVALSWRGASAPAQLSAQRRAAYASHMGEARALADRHDAFEAGSSYWAALRCAVLEADPAPAARVADDYEDLIELAPEVPAHMMALGHDLRPRRFGSWEMLDSQARRVIGQTCDIWGMAGYTWVYIGALERDAGALRRVDAELFTEGLHDILQRHPTQDMANRMAAFTGLTLGGPSDPGSARRRLADAFGWITQDYLRELHPEIWANAPSPGRPLPPEDSQDTVRRGRVRAISTMAEYYAPALDVGRRLVFTPDGVRMLKGD
ncbi:hypothetical protein [Sagittula sp. MA-2]|jgi:hypothetical protein|uniref:hypothetical protein n=1 Tax=Sagittula sp. MA-2 TaxID=3048007 RepID=UPI0024C3C615|nr:hypothetical protein [Sagittula sp. MA-2]WHZ33604.1 hypothetical protein QNI11_13205 [Sagittula sp. MA-2]